MEISTPLALRSALRNTLLAWSVLLLIPAAFAQDLFPDKALEAALRREVFEKRYNAEPLTLDDVKNISQVVGKGKGIKSLEGLQHCKALMKLDLEKNEIVDLGPIRDLKLLQSVDLASNQIQSLEPLTGLIAIQYLHIANNSIEDIGPLRGLIKMQSLYASGNKIKKLEPVFGLKKLWTLDVAASPIEDLNGIAELRGLQTINLKGCNVKTLDFAKSMREVRLLILQENPEVDLSALIEACEADAKENRRFAPFLRLYVDESLVQNPSKAGGFDKLKAIGVRINPPVK
ncbi:MAG: leucine-rich repeat domain-containing protein [Planctomycetota bacterium]|nr:leucine-rich repeat domain-containing protein [Planctomycetota bacterium]